MTRAERRHRRQVKIAYAAKKLRLWGFDPDRAAWWADNMCKCSCDMCRSGGEHKTEPSLIWDGELDD